MPNSGLPSELKSNMIYSLLAIVPEIDHKYLKLNTYVTKHIFNSDVSMMLKLSLISWVQEIYLLLLSE